MGALIILPAVLPKIDADVRLVNVDGCFECVDLHACDGRVRKYNGLLICQHGVSILRKRKTELIPTTILLEIIFPRRFVAK